MFTLQIGGGFRLAWTTSNGLGAVLTHTRNLLSDRHSKVAGADLRVSPLLLWLYRDPVTLESRLSARVQQLMDDGLLAEVESLNNQLPFIERSPMEFNQGNGNSH